MKEKLPDSSAAAHRANGEDAIPLDEVLQPGANWWDRTPLARSAFAGLVVFAVVAAGAIAQSLAPEPLPAEVPSLFDPEQAKAHPMTQAQRWQLDFELANEIGMMDHNSWRFMPPNSFEKRARWYEETAKYYRIADLLQQIVDFRRSAMRNNERVFNQLYQMGKQGDVGASCIAAMVYGVHKQDVTKDWEYSYDKVLSGGLEHQESGHKACVGLLAAAHVSGLLGYPKSYDTAKPYFVQRAIAGFYGSQRYMATTHLDGSRKAVPTEFSLYLCWSRVAYQQSPITGFQNSCDVIHADRSIPGVGGSRIPVTYELLGIANRWCDGRAVVTAQTCADLELQTNHSGR